MPFSQAVKDRVLKKAGYHCCMCGFARGVQPVVEVHHIIPDADDGSPDTEDNAAPLCPSCHAQYGDNPKLRKSIRDRRDQLYKQVEQMPVAVIQKTEALRQTICPDCGTSFFIGTEGFVLVDRKKRTRRILEDWKSWRQDESERIGKAIQAIFLEMQSRGLAMSGIQNQRTSECMAESKKIVAREKRNVVRKLEDMGYTEEEIAKMMA